MEPSSVKNQYENLLLSLYQKNIENKNKLILKKKEVKKNVTISPIKKSYKDADRLPEEIFDFSLGKESPTLEPPKANQINSKA